jgi:hypothetical protein
MLYIKKAPQVVELYMFVETIYLAYERSSSTKITMACLQQQQQQVIFANPWFM